MQASAGQFVATYGEIVGYMNALRARLTQLRSQWDGEAAKVFENTMVSWGQQFDQITKHLDEMADILIGGAGHYTSAEDLAVQSGSFFK